MTSRKTEHQRKTTDGTPAGSAENAESGHSERVAKRLARAGIASRREAEAMVEAGRVVVNGRKLASPAFNVTAGDKIEVDGKPLPAIERTRLFLFHKPAGVVTTNRDPEGRRTVFDVLPSGLPRLITVGRLDINTEGLLVLTNDGGLARILELPATGWLRRYRVRVHGKVKPEMLKQLEEGIAVDGVFYGSIEATLDREQGANAWLTLGLREGKNREVKNVLGALGLEVTRLIRISYGPFQLGALSEGAVQEIKGRVLREQLGERLVAESGANFEAPIAKPFSNKPVRAERPAAASPKAASERIEHGPRKKRSREEHNEEMRDRLQTRPDTRSQSSQERRNRGAYVWMAPGARPQGKRKRDEAVDGAAAGEKPKSERSRKAKFGDRDRSSENPAKKRRFGSGPSHKAGEDGPGTRASFGKSARPKGNSQGKSSNTDRRGPEKPFSGKPRSGKPRGSKPGRGK